jgi:hypothetical protein
MAPPSERISFATKTPSVGPWTPRDKFDRGETPTVSRVGKLRTSVELIDLHISDKKEVGKAPGRSNSATLEVLTYELGDIDMVELNRERIVKFGGTRAKEGARPVTLSVDIGALKPAIRRATAVHGIPVKLEPIDLGRVALKRLGLIGKSDERDRRPNEEKLENWSASGDRTADS